MTNAPALPRIFVHIPSYRDRECQWTVKDLFDKAAHPERIFVGICWQVLPEADQDCFTVHARPEQVRTLQFHINEAKGLGWARQHARSLWRGEEYSLQIDSHMRFVPGWDDKMLATLAACDSPDPVLTVYPPGYSPPDVLQQNCATVVQIIRRFTPGGLLEFGATPLPEGVVADKPMPTAACAGGFIFGSSRLLRDIPFDDQIYFNGEEPSLALRMWTHGFDLFSPNQTLIYHYYKRVEGSRHWNDDGGQARRLHARTLRRMQALCNPGECDPDDLAALGEFGLGQRRGLAAYEAFSGVNFAGRTLADHTQQYPYVRLANANGAQGPDETMAPAAGLSLFVLDREGLLFSAQQGEFYKLNEGACLVWCARENGLDWSATSNQLAQARSIPLAEAQNEVSSIVAHWRGQRLLQEVGTAPVSPPAFEPAPSKPTPLTTWPQFAAPNFQMQVRRYCVLGEVFDVRYGDADLLQQAHPMLAHLQAPASAAGRAADGVLTAARIHRHLYLYRNNDLLWLGDALDHVGPRLKFALLDGAIRRQQHLLHLHAGAVMLHDQLVLLPAVSGSGKTSLTARLVAGGATYFSDEVALIENDGSVRPVPLSLCVKAGGVSLLTPWFAGLPSVAEHLRQDGIRVRYLPPPSTSLPAADARARPSVMIFPRYVRGAPTRLERLSSTAALRRLLDECVAIPKPLDLAAAATLIDLIEDMACYTMTSGDLGSGAAAVEELCAEKAMKLANLV